MVTSVTPAAHADKASESVLEGVLPTAVGSGPFGVN
jgi:hypothetical protein